MSIETTPEPGELISFMHSLCDASAAPCLQFFRTATSIDNKSDGGSDAPSQYRSFDPVTVADREAERVIRGMIEKAFPDHGIHGEEFGITNPDSPYTWVLDPIDGTRNYIAGLPTWATLIGLLHEGKPIAGIMNQPYTQERYWAADNASWQRDRLGETRLAVRASTTKLADAIIAASAPDMFETDKHSRQFHTLASQCRLTRFGADCHNYARLAAGDIDIVAEGTLAPYDIVALIPLIEAAGGIVTTWTGDDPAQGGEILACASTKLHAQALEALSATA